MRSRQPRAPALWPVLNNHSWWCSMCALAVGRGRLGSALVCGHWSACTQNQGIIEDQSIAVAATEASRAATGGCWTRRSNNPAAGDALPPPLRHSG